jgi:hypothetical protein
MPKSKQIVNVYLYLAASNTGPLIYSFGLQAVNYRNFIYSITFSYIIPTTGITPGQYNLYICEQNPSGTIVNPLINQLISSFSIPTIVSNSDNV